MNFKIIDSSEGILNRIQWFDLKASVHSPFWAAKWGRTLTTPDGNTLVLRSTDLTETLTLLAIYEGRVDKITYDEAGAIECIFVTTLIRIETKAMEFKPDGKPEGWTCGGKRQVKGTS